MKFKKFIKAGQIGRENKMKEFKEQLFGIKTFSSEIPL